MTTILRISEAAGWRDLSKPDFPLAVRVSAEDAVLFGSAAESAADAWFGYNSGHVFLQPETGVDRVYLNGKPLEASAWLSAGDEIRIDETNIAVIRDDNVLQLSTLTIPKGPVLTPPEEMPQTPIEARNALDEADAGSKISDLPPVNPLPVRVHRPRRRLVIGTFSLLLLCVIFVLLAVPVRVSIEPSPDTMSLVGFPPALRVGERYLVLPGSYRVAAEKQGYRKFGEAINVGFGAEMALRYQLHKLPGLLHIVSQPISGAEVYVDGQVVGNTPLESFEIDAGNHELRIVAERYLPNTQSLEIQGMGSIQSLDVTLMPGWGRLRLASEPDAAEVWLNDELLGETPLQLEPMGGEYRIELKKEDWKPALAEVQINPGESIELPLFQLVKADGMLELTTKPSGATVMLDDEFRGRTPVTLVISADVDHRLSLSKSGFASVTRTVRAEAASQQNLDIQLKPEYAIVFVTSKPADAQLKVDGKVMGSASRRLRLTTSPHRIEIAKTGFETFSTTLTPMKGVSKKLDVRLKSTREVRDRSQPREIKTAEGQVLRRIRINEPIRFQMGASRREAGRRANETQYRVELTKPFYISEKEVANAEFKRFRQQHDSGSVKRLDLNQPDQPVASVNWDSAVRYLNWLSKKDGLPPAYREESGKMLPVTPPTTGYRLPTEAEWAFVARFEGGHRVADKPLKYPWEGGLPAKKNSGNFADSSAADKLPTTISGYSDGYPVAAAVGQFPPNAAGVYDIGGNVAEWCHDIYDVRPAIGNDVLRDPVGAANGKYHVVRGSSWRHGSITELRLTYRDYAEKSRDDLGFRIARYAE